MMIDYRDKESGHDHDQRNRQMPWQNDMPTTSQQRSRRLIGGVLVAIGGLWLLGIVAGQVFTQRHVLIEDRVYQARALEVNVLSGDVEIRRWDGPGIQVEVLNHDGLSQSDTLRIEQAGDTLQIENTGATGSFFWSQRELQYQISIPANTPANVSTNTGNIDVEDLVGAIALQTRSGDIDVRSAPKGLTAETVSGDINLSDVGGDILLHSISGSIALQDGHVTNTQIETTNGDIRVSGVTGPIQLKASNGDISIEDATNSALNVATVSGDIDFRGEISASVPSTLTTINGDISLNLPEDSQFTLRATTVNGDLSTDFELADSSMQKGQISGRAGSGGAALTLETTSGDIRVNRD